MKAVLWDFDGTIADTEPIWHDVERQLVASYGGELPDEVVAGLVGASMEKTATTMVEYMPGRPLTWHQIAEALDDAVIETVASQPLPYKPGVEALLAELAEQGVPCALVSTSTRRLLEMATSRMAAMPFLTIVGGEDVTHAKPNPEGYLTALARLGIEAEDALIIEDSALGSQAANAAGAVVLTVPDQVPVPQAPRRVIRESLQGLTVDDLREIWAANQ